MDATDVLYYDLAENEEISPERLDFIRREAVFVKAKEAAFRYASYQPRTESEIRARLAEDCPEDMIEQAVALLKEYNYVDDKAYARDFLRRELTAKHNGLARARFELRRKGVEDSVIDEAVAELGLDEDDEAEAALSALGAKLRGADFPEERKEKMRLYGFLARKGFSGSVIREAFERCGTDADEGYEDD